MDKVKKKNQTVKEFFKQRILNGNKKLNLKNNSKRLVLFTINFLLISCLYKIILKPFLKAVFGSSFVKCPYHPCCSDYVKMAFKENTFFLAVFVSLKRILKCNPFYKINKIIDYPPMPKKLNSKINMNIEKGSI